MALWLTAFIRKSWRGARDRGNQPCRLAHPSQDGHEGWAVHEPAAARDRLPHRFWANRAAATAFNHYTTDIQPLPGARELLAFLTQAKIPWAVATSGRMETARPVLKKLDVDLDRIPVVTRDQAKYGKPDPDLFLAAAARLRIGPETAWILGDSVWHMLAAQRARPGSRPLVRRLRPG